jgi:hypothetical protein
MADLALDGHAAVLADDLRDAARAAQVEHHRGAGRALERVGDQPAEQQVAADRSALLVEHDAAVGVAVEAETSVETALRHHGPRHHAQQPHNPHGEARDEDGGAAAGVALG